MVQDLSSLDLTFARKKKSVRLAPILTFCAERPYQKKEKLSVFPGWQRSLPEPEIL